MSGFKHDDGKPDMTFLREFPGALGEVCRVSEYGVRKYKKRGSWPTVPDGSRRYAAAMLQLMLDRRNVTRARIEYVAAEARTTDWPELHG